MHPAIREVTFALSIPTLGCLFYLTHLAYHFCVSEHLNVAKLCQTTIPTLGASASEGSCISRFSTASASNNGARCATRQNVFNLCLLVSLCKRWQCPLVPKTTLSDSGMRKSRQLVTCDYHFEASSCIYWRLMLLLTAVRKFNMPCSKSFFSSKFLFYHSNTCCPKKPVPNALPAQRKGWCKSGHKKSPPTWMLHLLFAWASGVKGFCCTSVSGMEGLWCKKLLV